MFPKLRRLSSCVGHSAHPKTRARIRPGSFLLGIAVGGALTLSAVGLSQANSQSVAPTSSALNVHAPVPLLTRNSFADAAEKALPSVVHLKWKSGMIEAAGSGFIVSEDGLIMTNDHVINKSNGASIQVMLNSGVTLTGRVHSRDPRSDLALVKITPSSLIQNLPVSTLGSSEQLRAGDHVLALGSPLSLQNSTTAGIVSAPARQGSEMMTGVRHNEYIQTDASINSGNSGGPLVNLDGEVVGVATMKLQDAGGIGFAVPVDVAKEVLTQLVSRGRVERPFIGIQMASSRDPVRPGVVVLKVAPSSPAEKAGLNAHDVIQSVDGTEVSNCKELRRLMPLDCRSIQLTVRRGGEHGQSLPLVLQPVPAERGTTRK